MKETGRSQASAASWGVLGPLTSTRVVPALHTPAGALVHAGAAVISIAAAHYARASQQLMVEPAAHVALLTAVAAGVGGWKFQFTAGSEAPFQGPGAAGHAPLAYAAGV